MLKLNFRKKLLIYPDLQLSFISYGCGFGLVICVILYLVNFYFIYKFKANGIELGLSADHVYFKFIDELERSLNYLYALTGVFSFILLSWLGLHLSNRVAGPIYNLQKNIEARLEGKSRRKIQFRKGDYFAELATKLNSYFESLDLNDVDDKSQFLKESKKNA